ncbi:hypothetical protein C4577_01660 [Candidatus Parcubacteria bacterium]|nr:MAG: hypothetical protein C4577_01660 [Candidatus Parcubacteria bacterium]
MLKLNWEKADEIRDLLDEGLTVSEIAKKYGVSDAQVSRIKYKDAWYDFNRDMVRRQRRAKQKTGG